MAGNFIIYLVGYTIAIIGVAYGLSAAGLAREWIVAVVLIMVGLGIVYALSRSQRDSVTRDGGSKDRASDSQHVHHEEKHFHSEAPPRRTEYDEPRGRSSVAGDPQESRKSGP